MWNSSHKRTYCSCPFSSYEANWLWSHQSRCISLWWGGLKGVIGLAMALIIAESDMPSYIKDPFLFITAGIVLVTSLI